MLANQLTTTITASHRPGIDAALALIRGVDATLANGLARLDPQGAANIADLAAAFTATPLAEPMAVAAEKIAAGSVGGEQLTFVAAARSALWGAVHDALLADLDTALERGRESARPGTRVPSPVAANLLNGTRSWLADLALSGWNGADEDMISGANQTIAGLLAQPEGRRLAVLLDGLAAELRACAPIPTLDALPLRRWADMWSRAMLLSHESTIVTEPVDRLSGRLMVLGVDVHEHPTAFQVQVHGVIEVSGQAAPRLVRVGVAAAKVDTIVGAGAWRLLDAHPKLLAALAEGRSLRFENMAMLDSGDLLWCDELAEIGEVVDPFAVARLQLPEAVGFSSPARDRHPAQIAECVLVEGYTVKKRDGAMAFDLGGVEVDVNLDRLPGCGPLTVKTVAASSACLGLMRWDAGKWQLQPLAVHTTVKRATVSMHNAEWALGPTDPKAVKAQAKTGDAVTVLRERAGRLLRK